MLFLVMTGTASNAGSLSAVVDLVVNSKRAQKIERITTDFVLDSRTLYQDIAQWYGLPGVRPTNVDSETLWLARCIYSETKDPTEMVLVGWVVRNRVETGYRGRRTFQGVVLDPYQFSAFNPTSSARFFYTHLNERSNPHGWDAALRIAYMVRTADVTARPFSIRTRHFFSERSMIDQATPYWVEDHEPVDVREPVDAERFRFYAGVA
ncbi:MAG: hypothetical protein HKN17_00255 [Rhodothermales bacterium]|nr:hypothetical protein [Rhodothermales bacterium]